jgi:hypothetical protein
MAAKIKSAFCCTYLNSEFANARGKSHNPCAFQLLLNGQMVFPALPARKDLSLRNDLQQEKPSSHGCEIARSEYNCCVLILDMPFTSTNTYHEKTRLSRGTT